MSRLFGEGIFLLLFVFIPAVIWFLIRGHNLPGGGFIAGCLAVAICFLVGLSKDVFAGKGISKFPDLKWLIQFGILVSVLSSFIGWFVNGIPFSSAIIFNPTPEIVITTEFIFDIGIFFCVIGVGYSIFENFLRTKY